MISAFLDYEDKTQVPTMADRQKETLGSLGVELLNQPWAVPSPGMLSQSWTALLQLLYVEERELILFLSQYLCCLQPNAIPKNK